MAQVLDIPKMKLSCQDCTLTELCLPRGLDINDVEKFETVVGQKPPVGRGESIYRTGDSFKSLFAVKSGSVKTTMIPPDGEEQIIGFHMPGELFGFDGMEEKHSCSAVALERTSLCELPIDRLEALSHQIPSLQRELYRIMAKEISTDQSMLLLLARRSAEDRLASFLLSLSSRFRARGFSDTEFILSMSRHDIANYLGLAAETVSRLFSRMHEEGILTVSSRRIEIHDREKLMSRVSGCDESQACA